MPSGLSAKGQRAWRIIMDKLVKHDMLYTGGSKAFHNPREWQGEYGRNSHLVVVYEGGDLGAFFDYNTAADYGSYNLVDEMNEAFQGSGVFTECCTSCYSAVYDA